MATSLAGLLDTLAAAAGTTVDSPAARADAAGALGQLGRALRLLRVDGVSAAVGDRREQQVAALADACTELGTRAPAAEAPLTLLAAAAADTAGVLRGQGTVGGRWAAAIAVAEAATPLTELLECGLSAGPAAQWLAEVGRHAAAVQQAAALQPPSPADAALLDHPLPFYDGVHAADPAIAVTESTAVLVHAAVTTVEVPSLAEVLAYTVAAETLADAAHTLGGAAGGAPAEAPDAAAPSWRAVRAALGPFDDGSRRLHPHAPPVVVAAGRLHAALRGAEEDPTRWPAPLRAAVAAGAQQLPALASGLDRAVRAWAHTGALWAYAADLPPREDRVSEYLRGHRPGGLIRADAVDLRGVAGALHQARLRSAAVAVAAADPSARRAVDFPRRVLAASRALLEPPQPVAALKKATEQAERHRQAARSRPTGRGRPR